MILGSSTPALILRKNMTASRPSTKRWSYVSATYIIGRITTWKCNEDTHRMKSSFSEAFYSGGRNKFLPVPLSRLDARKCRACQEWHSAVDWWSVCPSMNRILLHCWWWKCHRPCLQRRWRCAWPSRPMQQLQFRYRRNFCSQHYAVRVRQGPLVWQQPPKCQHNHGRRCPGIFRNNFY